MRVLILNTICFPETDMKSIPMAKELIRQGHEVQVLTTFPSYPFGKIYTGYKQSFFFKEYIDGVEVLRVPVYASHNSNAIERILTYLSFAFTASTFGLMRIRKADVMYVYHPPGSIAIPAILIKYLRRIPMVYDILDIWPDSLAYSGMIKNKFILDIVGAFSKFTYRIADHVTCLSEGYRKLLTERGVNPNKLSVIHNWAYETELNAGAEDIANIRKKLNVENKFVFLYAGNMGPAQGGHTILDAAKLVASNSNIRIVMLGDGMEKPALENRVKEEGIENVVFSPYVLSTEVGKYLLASDVMIVHLKTDPLTIHTIPSKIQSYMQAGRPVLLGVSGESGSIIEAAECGIVCTPESPTEMAAAMTQFASFGEEKLKKLGENASSYYQSKLSISAAVERYLKIFNSIRKHK